jgi:plastocyanin
MRRAALLAIAALASVPAATQAQHDHGGAGTTAGPGSGPMVSVGFDAFSPLMLDVLTGDTVNWPNDSARPHTVTADDGSFDSGRIVVRSSFAQRFGAPGTFPYHCTLHPSMRGEVDVHDLLLTSPAAPAGPNRPYPIFGRSALGSGTQVAIEADTGSGFARVATASVGTDGTFAASVIPETTSAFRAVAGTTTSPPVQLIVLDHSIKTAARRLKGGRLRVEATVAPAAPGSRVVLQLHLKDRFGWWPVQMATLDARSHARFVIRQRARVPARVVLTLPDDATILATSATKRRY